MNIQKNIQIQHLLKLNKVPQTDAGVTSINSNTTLVKVKSQSLLNAQCFYPYSNTTLVKVKFGSHASAILITPFKYNTC